MYVQSWRHFLVHSSRKNGGRSCNQRLAMPVSVSQRFSSQNHMRFSTKMRFRDDVLALGGEGKPSPCITETPILVGFQKGDDSGPSPGLPPRRLFQLRFLRESGFPTRIYSQFAVLYRYVRSLHLRQHTSLDAMVSRCRHIRVGDVANRHMFCAFSVSSLLPSSTLLSAQKGKLRAVSGPDSSRRLVRSRTNH